MATAILAWATILVRQLPAWRTTLTWGNEGLVLFDSRVPLWAVLGLWGLLRLGRAIVAELAPYMIAAAWVADPESFARPLQLGGWQMYSPGEGVVNLSLLVLPFLVWVARQSDLDTSSDPELVCLLVGSCFWGWLPTLLVFTMAVRSAKGGVWSVPEEPVALPARVLWRAAGIQAVLVTTVLHWMEVWAIIPRNGLTSGWTVAVLFALFWVLPIGRKMGS